MRDLTRRYEALLLVDPGLTEEALGELEAQITECVTKASGYVTEKFNLGKRRLSFKIGRFSEAIYLEIRFTVDPSQIAGLKKSVSLMEKVIRFMVGRESTQAVPVSIGASHPSEASSAESVGRA